MGRQDAQRSVEHQLLQPWDSQTPPPKLTELGVLTAALKKWERDKGLAVNMRDQIRANTREVLARRKLLNGNREDSTPQ